MTKKYNLFRKPTKEASFNQACVLVDRHQVVRFLLIRGRHESEEIKQPYDARWRIYHASEPDKVLAVDTYSNDLIERAENGDFDTP